VFGCWISYTPAANFVTFRSDWPDSGVAIANSPIESARKKGRSEFIK
jgi:hypothetical protein